MPKRLLSISLSIMIVMMSSISVLAAGSVKITRVESEIHENNVNIKVAWPKFSGIDNEKEQAKLNVIVKEIAECKQMDAARSATNVNCVYDYSVARNCGGIVSIVWNENRSQNNANETNNRTGITFNATTGQQYDLNEIFGAQYDYIDAVSSEIKQQIIERDLEGKQIKEFKKIKRKQNFYLTETALIIPFISDEYFDGSLGVIEFTIPLEKIKSMLNPDIIIIKA